MKSRTVAALESLMPISDDMPHQDEVVEEYVEDEMRPEDNTTATDDRVAVLAWHSHPTYGEYSDD